METITMSSTDDLGGGAGEDFLGLFGDGHPSSSDDLFDLVWRGAAGGGGSMEGQPICHPLSPRQRPSAAAAVPVPERLEVTPPPATPSEAEMASWLFPIVCGAEFAGGGDAAAVVAGLRARVDDDQMVPSPSGNNKESAADHKLQEDKRKARGGRRSHHQAQAHSLTEKRRRCKIKEKLKTLQQLVPGCNDNSNQASTLDQTIRYMKSLQQHIQAMSSFRCGMKPTSVAVYPVVQQAPCMPSMLLATGHIAAAGMALGQSPAIVPFRAIFPSPPTLQP